jgi:hypothetical protein
VCGYSPRTRFDLIIDTMFKSAIVDGCVKVNNVQDYRNYEVTCERAKTHLGFLPKYDISRIVKSLHSRLEESGDLSNDLFYNINTFKCRNGLDRGQRRERGDRRPHGV